MDPASGAPGVLEKIDALLTRHRTGAPTQQDLATAVEQADRAAIPVLTEVIAEADTIPVLTDAVTSPEASEPGSVSAPTAQTSDEAEKHPPPNEESLRRMEECLMRELENRIALELTVVLDRALEELLERSRDHIRHAVREALGNELSKQLGSPPHGTANPPDRQ